jgi:hypothetical protein
MKNWVLQSTLATQTSTSAPNSHVPSRFNEVPGDRCRPSCCFADELNLNGRAPLRDCPRPAVRAMRTSIGGNP